MASTLCMKNRIFNNISWLFFDKIIRMLGGLAVGIWVARYLGPERFGILNYGMAFVAIFSFLPNLGLDQIVVRDVTKYNEKTDQILGSSLVLKLSGSFLAIFFIMLFVLNLNKTDVLVKYVIISFSIGFIFQSLDVIDFFYQSQLLSKHVVVSRNISFLIVSAIKIYLILSRSSLIWFAITATFALLLDALFLTVAYTKTHHSILNWRFDKGTAYDLMKSSWPLMFSTFLISIHMKVDQVMIGHYMINKDVGLYSVAVRLSTAWYFIPSIIVSTLMPYFVSLRHQNYDKYLLQLTQLYSVMFWIGTCAGIITLFFGQNIILLLFGEAYRNSFWALVYNMWNGIFISQAIARGIWMISEDLQKYRLYNNAIVVILNITLNIILIPRIGIAGAAIATFFTQFLGTWVITFLWAPLRDSNLAMIKSVNPIYLVNLGGTIIEGFSAYRS